MPRPKFNRVTYRQIYKQLSLNLNINIAFYTIYIAGPKSSIYNDPETLKEAKKRAD